MATPTATAREHSPLAVLMDPRRDIPIAETDIRVEDFLSDKIQTAADLADLKSLLAKVEEQKKILQAQLDDVQSQLSQAKQASTNQASDMRKQTDEFTQHQAGLEERLMTVTNSSTPAEASALLEAPMKKLHKVELANKYVELLKVVEELKKHTLDQLPADPKGALVPFVRLKELAKWLKELQEPAEGAAVHLVNYVLQAPKELWSEMKKTMFDEFDGLVQKTNWPEGDINITREWSDCFDRLLDLQGPELLHAKTPIILWPMDILTRTFVQEFKYHFYSARPTNDPHQLGDNFFVWFTNLTSKWEDFLQTEIGPLLAAHFRCNLLAGSSLLINPVAAFITAMLPILKEKVDNVLAQIGNEPQFLSRFMVQIMEFDEKIRNQFAYDGGDAENGWKGLSADILDVWFGRWLQAEKGFAWKRFREIIDSSESSFIDFDSADFGKTKSTHASQQVVDLYKLVTNQYKNVPSNDYKMKFMIDIQAEILDEYYKDLGDYLATYERFASTLTRIALGISAEDREKVEGLKGLDRLCRVFCSADHIVSMCKDLNNDEVFLAIWDFLQSRSEKQDPRRSLVAGMSLDEVRGVTSSKLGTGDPGTFYEVSIEEFKAMRNRAERLIISAMKSLAQQQEGLEFLEKALSRGAYHRIQRQVETIFEPGQESRDHEDEDGEDGGEEEEKKVDDDRIGRSRKKC